MRFPFSHTYRAFPELDEFSNAQCELFVKAAKRKYRLSHFKHAVVSLVLSLLCTAVVVAAVSGVTAFAKSTVLAHSQFADELMLMALLSALVATPAFVCILRHDRWLRKAIQRRLHEMQCLGCSYSLLGLPPRGEIVVCPECGVEFDLRAHQLSRQELMLEDDQLMKETASSVEDQAKSS